MENKYIDKNSINENVLNEILRILGKYDAHLTDIENISDVAKCVYHFKAAKLKIEHKKFSDLRYPQILTSLLESFLSQVKFQRNEELIIALLEIKRPFERNRKESIIEKIENFLIKYNAKMLNWLILDANGNLYGNIDNYRIDSKIESLESYADRASKVIESHLLQFSPIQQWLSKILLLNGTNLNNEYNSLWPIGNYRNIQDYKVLSKVSGVSETSCYNFLKLLEEKNFINIDKYNYQFKNLDLFFDLWKSSFLLEKKEELFLIPRKPFGNMDNWQQSAVNEFSRFCNENSRGIVVMGGHLACRAQGLDFSNNNSTIFYTKSVNDEDFENFLMTMKLRPSEDKNGSIRVIVQKKDMPILKIDQIGIERYVFADPIQLILDVEYLGGRGSEQSNYIYEKILKKHFRSLQWQS